MEGRFRRRNLPHLDVPHGTYFLTFCLAGSLSSAGYVSIARRWRERGLRPPPEGVPSKAWQNHCALEAFLEVDRVLDGVAARWLADPRLAAVVEDCLLHADGTRYRIVAHTIMPSHCHVVLDTSGYAGASREKIMHSLKRHTARECNRLLGRNGAFWQAESYDRVVRDGDELERIVRYIEWNPVEAGLCDRPEAWRFSSAYRAGRRPDGGLPTERRCSQ